jgi:hypothetical protein
MLLMGRSQHDPYCVRRRHAMVEVRREHGKGTAR